MESELFGHAKGAFSGAAENKRGLVELADGGTAFLDEIGDLPLEMQVKLLRLVQEREFRAVGALVWRKVDVRIIAATHRDLKTEVAGGRFRQDLYYRLNVFTIRIAPLRERKQDIPLLAEHFLAAGRQAGLPRFDPPPEIMARLMAYDWPGNVRELQNCVERAVALGDMETIEVSDLPANLQGLVRKSSAIRLPAPPTTDLDELEHATIQRVLDQVAGDKALAGKMLGISRATLYRKIKRYGIETGPRGAASAKAASAGPQSAAAKAGA
jgi:transcriptional regulator with PAS, ATPase and Fis domain